MVVIDTNVLLVANMDHADVSPECVEACIRRLQALQKAGGVVVVDDEYRIIGEYNRKTKLKPPKGVGDVFLKWLLRNYGDERCVNSVAVTAMAGGEFAEFPGAALQGAFDSPDRIFVAVANTHPEKPPILQAADCKWLDWWEELAAAGVSVEFLCGEDACKFYAGKFPNRPAPSLPVI